MKKGIIICGYPGVGKSAVAGWNSCADLESSNFSHTYDGIPQKTKMWVPRYCQAAVDLARQGYTVLISTHLSVVQYLKNMLFIPEEVAKPVIFCPDHRWKQEWVERLKERYIQFPCSKNERAMQRVVHYFEDDIFNLVNSGLLVFQPAAMDYDLKNYIYIIQKKYLDGEGGMLQMLDYSINATDGDGNYQVGFRNGLRFCKSLIDGEEPKYERSITET